MSSNEVVVCEKEQTFRFVCLLVDVLLKKGANGEEGGKRKEKTWKEKEVLGEEASHEQGNRGRRERGREGKWMKRSETHK